MIKISARKFCHAGLSLYTDGRETIREYVIRTVKGVAILQSTCAADDEFWTLHGHSRHNNRLVRPPTLHVPENSVRIQSVVILIF